MIKHPIQPVAPDQHGRLRFKSNEIVQFLLDHGDFDMNKLACLEFSDDDRVQFAQLIGYSLGGFGELSYVSDEDYDAACRMAEAPATPGKYLVTYSWRGAESTAITEWTGCQWRLFSGAVVTKWSDLP